MSMQRQEPQRPQAQTVTVVTCTAAIVIAGLDVTLCCSRQCAHASSGTSSLSRSSTVPTALPPRMPGVVATWLCRFSRKNSRAIVFLQDSHSTSCVGRQRKSKTKHKQQV